MKTLRSFAQLSLVFVGSMLIAGQVNASGIRDFNGRGEIDFSFLSNKGQFGSKTTGPSAHSNWLGNIEDQLNKHGAEHRFSGFSIFGKHDDYSQAKKSLREDPLKFLFGSSRGKKYEDHFKTILENNPRYAEYLVGFDGSDRGPGLLAKKIISQDQSGSASVVPIPAAAWLMFSALAVLGWRRKKTHDKESPAVAP